MSRYTLHDDVLIHAYFTPERQVSFPTGGIDSFDSLWGDQEGGTSSIIGSTLRLVGWYLDARNKAPRRIEQDLDGFQEVVEILRRYNIAYRVSKNAICITYDSSFLPAHLTISYDAKTGIYTEHYDGIQIKYLSLFSLMKRIEDHDFDLMSCRDSEFRRRSFTEGFSGDISGGLVDGSTQSSVHRNGYQTISGSESSLPETRVLSDRSGPTMDKVSKIPIEALTELSNVLGRKIPNEIRGNSLHIRYLEDDRSKDITIVYDQVSREYRIKRTYWEVITLKPQIVYATSSELMAFIIDDYNNMIAHHPLLYKEGMYLEFVGGALRKPKPKLVPSIRS